MSAAATAAIPGSAGRAVLELGNGTVRTGVALAGAVVGAGALVTGAGATGGAVTGGAIGAVVGAAVGATVGDGDPAAATTWMVPVMLGWIVQ